MRILIRSFWLVALALITISEAEECVEALRSVVEGVNQFSSSFFETVLKRNSDVLVTSPLSLSVALAMAAYGARGNTETQFRNVLHLPTSDSLAISGYQSLIDNLNSINGNKPTVANKIFVPARLNLRLCYKYITEVYFRSVPQLVNFAQNKEAANIINSWVEQSTNNLIKDVISAETLGDTTGLVLVDAIYFKGQWKDKFYPALTSDMPFDTSKGEVKNVPTMYKQGNYKYGELPDLNATFVVIPYEGNELSMVIILPNEIDGLSDVEKKLQNINLANILSQGHEKKILLSLPKFEVETVLELNDVLKEMGLTDAFTNDDFSEIAYGANLRISNVIQKAHIVVNEEGSEGAGAVVFRSLAAPEEHAAPPLPSWTPMKINRPFYYAIYKSQAENQDVVMLFSGHVKDPSLHYSAVH